MALPPPATVTWNNNRITFHPGAQGPQAFNSAEMLADVPGPVANPPNWHLTFTGITRGVILWYPAPAPPINLVWVGSAQAITPQGTNYHANPVINQQGNLELHVTDGNVPPVQTFIAREV